MSAIASARAEINERKARTVVFQMRAKGLSLSVSFERRGANGRRWWLSDGTPVPGAIARRVTADPCVVGVGDSLFPSGPCQTFRHVSADYTGGAGVRIRATRRPENTEIFFGKESHNEQR